ncbi:MAG: biotin-dependent carboxyltransferase family protein [Alcanivoracaceae bacterium]|nr:biotin-dependent carboxyltransferase family protein [Alcanivoracaceae bacterium]
MIEVISAGLYTTIQDQGRCGFRNIGVPTSGAMDMYSARLANALLDNDVDAAVMEMTYYGSTLKFNADTLIAITGANCSITLNTQAVKMNAVTAISCGSILKIGSTVKGVRIYMAIVGGFNYPKVLNSRSFYQGITPVSQIYKGDRLNTVNQCRSIINRSSLKVNNSHFDDQTINVTTGPEFRLLDKINQQILCTKTFRISTQSNRMAYKLEINDNLTKTPKTKDIITSCVQPGTVQLTPSGQLIVLMRDAQTTGGYARILQLTDNSINRLSQKMAGKLIVFNLKD